MAEPSLTLRAIERCREALFTGIVRVHTRQAEGEIWFLSGMLERVRFGVSRNEDAMSRLLAADGARIDVVPCLPNPVGGFEKGHPMEGDLGARLPVDLLRFCEMHALTCTVELWCGESRGEAVYRLGELISVRCDAESERAAAEMLEWRAGRFRFILPSVDLPASAQGALDRAPPTQSAEVPMTTESAAWRTAANEALKRKVVEVEAKLKAEERRQADEVESRRTIDEPEPKRTVDEPEPKRTIDEVESRRTIDEPEPKRTIDEPEPKRTIDEPAPKDIVEEAEPARVVEAAEPKRSDGEASAAAHSHKADETRPAVNVPVLSIAVRLQRVTTEYVDISVPVTNAMMGKEPDADGSRRIEGGALFAEAERLAREQGATWQREGEPRVGLHPVQTPNTDPGS